MAKLVAVEDLKVGMITSAPVFSDRDRSKLVGEKESITNELIEIFNRHKVQYVQIVTAEDSTPKPKSKPSSPVKGVNAPNVKEEVIKRNIIEEDGKQKLKIDSSHAKKTHTVTIERTEEIFNKFREGTALDVKEMKGTVDELVDEVLKNQQAFSNLSIMRSKDETLYAHSVDVAILALILGKGMELDVEQLRGLTFASLLHDIGKVHIPNEILYKKGAYTEDEKTLIKQHTTKGYKMLIDQDVDNAIALVALQHHEWIDGSGFPDGTKGGRISKFSKIAALSNVYNTLTVQNARMSTPPPYKAMHMILGEVGRHFDVEIAKMFQRVIGVYPNGSRVELSNGLICRVVDQNIDFPLRPIVQVVMDENKVPSEGIDLIDLEQKSDVYIKSIVFDTEA